MSTVENELFADSPITERPPIRWPGGARVAFYIGLDYGWRDHGLRVGIWRTIQSLDRHGMRASVLLDSDVATRYPQVIQAGLDRDWAWLGHGRGNAILQAGMSRDQERSYLTEVVDTIAAATGQRPRGWLGPGRSGTFQTPALLAELGLRYVLDWTNDDQPYRLRTPGMLSVPYTVELNDLGLFLSRNVSGPEFVQIVKDQFDQLHADAEHSGRVMALALHPFVTGQAFRHRYLEQALAYLAAQSGIWLTTSDDIAEHYQRATGQDRRPAEGLVS
jgi:allantoinase